MSSPEWLPEKDFELLTNEVGSENYLRSSEVVGSEVVGSEVGSKKYTTTTVSKHPSKYPWSTWLDGQMYVAKPGIDFDTTPSVFQITLANTGARRGLYVLSSKQKDGRVAFRFFKTAQERDAARVVEE